MEHKEVSAKYKSYKFDSAVIEKLPIYDSLAYAILEKLSFFQQHINEKDSYRGYRYLPGSDREDVSRKLPEDVAIGIEPYFTQLGKNFIYGFDVFKDSTIKIYIRNSQSQGSPIEMEENLSYYPVKSRIRRREYPVRDTILNEHWQYWVRFSEWSLFR